MVGRMLVVGGEHVVAEIAARAPQHRVRSARTRSSSGPSGRETGWPA